jgi:hypothetical protein
MNADEIRELEDQNPMPKDAGGDKYLVNGNMIPINEATNKNNKGGDGTNGNTNPD